MTKTNASKSQIIFLGIQNARDGHRRSMSRTIEIKEISKTKMKAIGEEQLKLKSGIAAWDIAQALV